MIERERAELTETMEVITMHETYSTPEQQEQLDRRPHCRRLRRDKNLVEIPSTLAVDVPLSRRRRSLD